MNKITLTVNELTKSNILPSMANIHLITGIAGAGKDYVTDKIKGIEFLKLDHFGRVINDKWMIDIEKVFENNPAGLSGTCDNLSDVVKAFKFNNKDGELAMYWIKPSYSIFKETQKVRYEEGVAQGQPEKWVNEWRELSMLTEGQYISYMASKLKDYLENVKPDILIEVNNSVKDGNVTRRDINA